MPTFNATQTLFSLSMLSSLGDSFVGNVGTIEAALTPDLLKQLQTMQPQIGTWQLVWGPAVYELPTSSQPDNVMFVVRGTDPTGAPQLVVAIAGTNPYAVLDWIVEDFFVSIEVFWKSAFALDRMISTGTFIGLSALQTMTPSGSLPGGTSQPGAGLTLQNFLATQVGAPIAITVTGHSLGGALAPTLALWLNDTRADWDPAGNASLSVLASAGPTAGNQGFAAYSDAQIGPRITRVHNPLDVVPHAWARPDLLQVAGLYAPAIQPDVLLDGFQATALAISALGSYTQINANAPALPGATINAAIIVPGATAFANFFAQLAYQHVDAYYTLLGLQADPTLGLVLQRIKASAPLLTDTLPKLQSRLGTLP
ncbi:MAG TPA: lipase [Thermoanaerobaculia bacterium]